MTETRLCACGCQRPIIQGANEKPVKFNLRQYVHPSHYYGAVRKHKTKTCPVCRKRFTRKRKTDGRLESTCRFDKRITCSRECYAEARKGKKRHVKVREKSPTVSPKPRKAAAKPKQAKLPKPKPAKPPVPPQPPVVFTGLPDPRAQRWQTIAPAIVRDNPCPLHPSEHAGRCTACKISSTPHKLVAHPFDSAPVWRRS